jgi:hypothetical protein
VAQVASAVAQQQAAALDTILEGLERSHDPATRERIEGLFVRGARKWTPRGGAVDSQDEAITMLLEAVASLSKQVEDLRAEVEAVKPRRGRPRQAREN